MNEVLLMKIPGMPLNQAIHQLMGSKEVVTENDIFLWYGKRCGYHYTVPYFVTSKETSLCLFILFLFLVTHF